MRKEVALITGASSGIGWEMAKQLSLRGYDLILVARRKERLEELAQQVQANCRIIPMDLSEEDACYQLYEQTKGEPVTILINCAGYGLFGSYTDSSMDKELEMINLNIKALHILTKLFLRNFRVRGKGHILNVSSVAGMIPGGPYMSTYYATKAYVTSLTNAIAQELRDSKSPVYVGALHPGPVDTEFNDVARVSFGLKGITPEQCARYGLKKMFAGETIIIPSALIKMAAWGSQMAPRKLVVAMAGRQQRKKMKS